jgi:hypothetical protein
LEDIPSGSQGDNQVNSATLSLDLFQDKAALYFAPIRHHSPACAWALTAMIRDIKPAQVLIEAPRDLDHHIPVLLDKDTVPPVALVSILDGEERRAAYYPFTDQSPEYVAMREAEKLGARIGFIDLPTSERTCDGADAAAPMTQDETLFDTGDYVRELCHRLGCRNGFELWDHLFEARIGSSDWRCFFADCGTYCAGLRSATPDGQIVANGDAAREAHMSASIAAARADMEGPIVVVVGGFHAPALITPKAAQLKAKSKGKSYLIRYGYGAMDALAGYGAGLPQPGYYDSLWQTTVAAGGTPDWQTTNAHILEGFANWMVDQNQRISVPAKVEALRLAAGLANMRGRDGALRHDLMDGLTTALVKGETGHSEIWSERLRSYLRGVKLGDVPASAGSPPLIEDARRRARALRFDISDGAERRRKLDIRRKPTNLEASQFLHAMKLLDAGFARREVGPDYVQDARTELLFEEWTYAWSPAVEGRLTQIAALADKIPSACLAQLAAERTRLAADGSARDLSQLIDLLLQGVLAGLGVDLAGFLKGITHDIQQFGTFESVAPALRRLHLLVNATGPLRIPKGLDISGAQQAAFERLIYLCDDLPRSTEDNLQPRLHALRLLNEVLADDTPGGMDRAPYDAALLRVIQQQVPPEILGAILGCCVLAKQIVIDDLVQALRGNFNGSVLDQSDRMGVMRGLLETAPQLLWQTEGLLAEVDDFLANLSEDNFVALLPYLRLSFTKLNPREIDRVAEMLGALHGVGSQTFTESFVNFTAQDLTRGIAANTALRDELIADGLEDWIAP